jgi:hypothetical protein
MTTAIIVGPIASVALMLLLFIARRVLRLAVKLAIAGVIVGPLLVAAAVGWWPGWFWTPGSRQTGRPAASQTHHSNSNRRAATP